MESVRNWILVAAALGALALACASSASSAPRAAGEHGAPDDGVALFDGATLDGWRGDERYWSVRDGAIVAESTTEQPCDRSTYLWFDGDEYGDFDLSLSYKLESGNSGVQIRSQVAGDASMMGYQVDLEAGPTHVGSLYEQFGLGVLAARGERTLRPAEGATARETFADPAELLTHVDRGGWNELVVEATGPRLRVSINGVLMSELVDAHPRFAQRSGRIGLQLHEGDPMRVSFRDIRIVDRGGTRGVPRDLPPQWIWPERDPQSDSEAWFQRSFELEGEVGVARLYGSGDDRLEVYVNGALVAISENWRYRFDVDVREFLHPGTNVISVWCRNEASDAGFWLELRTRAANAAAGARRKLWTLSTDASWRTRARAPAQLDRMDGDDDWRAPYSFGPIGTAPWGMPLESPRGRPTNALDATDIEVAPGFRAQRVYSVAQSRQGSWVSLAVDERGRFIACDQIGNLHRVTVPASGVAHAEDCERIDIDLGDAQGLLYAFGSLYVCVNETSGRWKSGLYRVRDTDGDDRYDEVEQLTPLTGGGEHGPHALVLAPDGASILVVGGNAVAPPDALARSRARLVDTEDALLPQEPDPNGHPPPAQASGGWIARVNPDGKNWELIATGLRNAYDVAVDRNGELFTVDSDMEWDLGLPWYRSPRVLHVVSGADYGWRYGSGKGDASWPDAWPAALDIGPGSPSGLLHGSRLRFPGEYADALFVGDWAFGRILVVRFDPRGASFDARVETFASGTPLPVADLVAGADGALYFVTGGRGLESAIYRISSTTPDAPPAAAPVAPTALADVRTGLEAYHGRVDDGALEAAWPHLASTDPYVRGAARVAVESQPLAQWRARALAETEPRARLQAWLALARSGSASARRAILERLAGLPWDDTAPERRRDQLRVWDRALRDAELDDPLRARYAALLGARFPTNDAKTDEALAPLLVALEWNGVVDALLARSATALSARATIHYAFLLRRVDHGWTSATRAAYFTCMERLIENADGGQSMRKYLVAMRQTALDVLTADERAALGDLARSISPTPTVVSASGDFVKEWKLGDLLPHLDDIGPQRDIARGAQLFDRATCLQCHRVNGAGGVEGPDLTHAGSRFTARDLVDAILYPSEVVSDQFRDSEVWTTSNRVYVGTILREDAEELVIRTRAPEFAEHVLAKEDIELQRPTPLSRMPSGLFDTMELAEILDLLAYVSAQR